MAEGRSVSEAIARTPALDGSRKMRAERISGLKLRQLLVICGSTGFDRTVASGVFRPHCFHSG